MSLTSIPTSIGGSSKQVLVGVDPNGHVAPAHLLINSSGVEIGNTAQPIIVTVANPESSTVTVGNFPVGVATDASLVTINNSLMAFLNRIATLEVYEQPYTGIVKMVLDVPQAPQRAVRIVCTVAGNVSMTYTDGSIEVLPIEVGVSTVVGAYTTINSNGTTATATFASLK